MITLGLACTVFFINACIVVQSSVELSLDGWTTAAKADERADTAVLDAGNWLQPAPRAISVSRVFSTDGCKTDVMQVEFLDGSKQILTTADFRRCYRRELHERTAAGIVAECDKKGEVCFSLPNITQIKFCVVRGWLAWFAASKQPEPCAREFLAKMFPFEASLLVDLETANCNKVYSMLGARTRSQWAQEVETAFCNSSAVRNSVLGAERSDNLQASHFINVRGSAAGHVPSLVEEDVGYLTPVDKLADLQTEGKYCTMNAILITAMLLKKEVTPSTLQNLRNLGNLMPLATLNNWLISNPDFGLFILREIAPADTSLLNWILTDRARSLPEPIDRRGRPTRIFIAQVVDSQQSRCHAVVFDLEEMQILETDPQFPRPLSLKADNLSETLNILDLCAVHKAQRVWVRSPRRKRKR